MATQTPQMIQFAAYEAPVPTVSMVPATDVAGWTFVLNIRTLDEVVVLQSTTYTVSDVPNGVVGFPLTSAQTGVILGPGDFLWDVWRTNAGSEKRLAYGTMSVLEEQWKP